MKTSVFPRFFAYFAKSLCAWQCIWRLPKKHCILPWKGLDFRAPGQQNPSKIDFQTHKNVKVGAKSSRETSREAVETDFGPQDSDLGAPEADFGGQNGGGLFSMRILELDQRNAQGL